jgi:hypothetical protein
MKVRRSGATSVVRLFDRGSVLRPGSYERFLCLGTSIVFVCWTLSVVRWRANPMRAIWKERNMRFVARLLVRATRGAERISAEI